MNYRWIIFSAFWPSVGLKLDFILYWGISVISPSMLKVLHCTHFICAHKLFLHIVFVYLIKYKQSMQNAEKKSQEFVVLWKQILWGLKKKQISARLQLQQCNAHSRFIKLVNYYWCIFLHLSVNTNIGVWCASSTWAAMHSSLEMRSDNAHQRRRCEEDVKTILPELLKISICFSCNARKALMGGVTHT